MSPPRLSDAARVQRRCSRLALLAVFTQGLGACASHFVSANAPAPSMEAGLLGDQRFSPRNVRQGLWSPAEFQRRVLGGIYCMEGDDASRVPVLFIHGMHGSPRDFSLLIRRLDRQSFRPCVFFYASGASLADVAAQLTAQLRELGSSYGVRTMAIVAHSMGGLIARDVLVNGLDERAPAVPVLVTISTPWNGHAGAAFGARYAPVAVDSWFDLASGSAYIDSLFSDSARRPKHFPAGTRHHLIFTYGKSWPSLGASSDEVVTVASQLGRPAQEQAQRIYGFNATHAGILNEAAAADLLNRILASAALPSQPGHRDEEAGPRLEISTTSE